MERKHIGFIVCAIRHTSHGFRKLSIRVEMCVQRDAMDAVRESLGTRDSEYYLERAEAIAAEGGSTKYYAFEGDSSFSANDHKIISIYPV